MEGSASVFPAGAGSLAKAPLSHPPTAYSMHHAQLSTDTSISVIAELSGKKKPKPINKKQYPKQQQKVQSTNKSALLPTFLSLFGKHITPLLCLFPPGFWQTTCLCFHTYCLPFKSPPLSVMLFSEFCPLSQWMYSAEARSLEKAMNSFPN